MAEAETRFERELRDMLTIELDAVHGPHPRWADAPVARRIGRVQTPPARRPQVALFAVLAAAVLVAFALAVAVFPKNQPVATQPANTQPTLEPLPSSVSPSAFPTTGEVRLGAVAIATQNSAPALAVRVITLPSRAEEAVVRIDIRVVGPVVTPVGMASFGVLHDNKRDPLPTPLSQDPLAIAPGASLGTTVSAEFTIPVSSDEWADLAYYGTSTPAFLYPIHRPAAAIPSDGTCPGLAEWAAASARPADASEPRVSFAPADLPTAPTTGTIAVNTVGGLASTDGQLGAYVRVSNVRFCDRFPDVRPDEQITGKGAIGAKFLVVDFDIQVLRDNTLDGWIDGDNLLRGRYRGSFWQMQPPRPPFWLPGITWRTELRTGPGWTRHGAMAWAVPGEDGEVTVGVFGMGAKDMDPPQFSFAVRAGPVGPWDSPTASPDTAIPSLTPPSLAIPADTSAVVLQGGATTEVRIGRVQQVPRYTGVVPKRAGNVFLEFVYQSLGQSGAYTWNPNDWVVVNPDGSVAEKFWETADPPDGSNGYTPIAGAPDFIGINQPITYPGGEAGAGVISMFPIFQVAEVPPTGRITLEYRPNGGPATATWVLREQ